MLYLYLFFQLSLEFIVNQSLEFLLIIVEVNPMIFRRWGNLL